MLINTPCGWLWTGYKAVIEPYLLEQEEEAVSITSEWYVSVVKMLWMMVKLVFQPLVYI